MDVSMPLDGAKGRHTTMAQFDEAVVRERLNVERERLEHEIYELTRGERSVQLTDPYSDTVGLKSEQADDAEVVFEAQRNQGVADNAQILLKQVHAALGRLDNGSYGICANCGKEI